MTYSVKSGDWVIERSSWGRRLNCYEITKVTAKLLFAHYGSSNNTHRIRPDEILFAGTEAEVKKVHEKLVSSDALYNDETQRAHLRKIERDKKIISQVLSINATDRPSEGEGQ